MKLAPLLLAAPMVLTMVAADPRPGPERRVLDRWQFARQEGSSTAAGGGAAASSTPAGNTASRETSSAAQSTPAAETTTPQQQPTSTSTSTTPAQQPTSTSSTSRQVATSTSSTPQQASPSASSTQGGTSQGQQASQTPTTTSEFTLSTPPPSTTFVSTTDQHGNVVTSVVVYTLPPTSVPAAASETAASTEKKGVSQSTVIGLAVTGSIAGLLIILLIVWKLTNKRFADLEDVGDDDAIKWPELNKDSAAMTPIPARPSTRAAGTESDTLGTDFDRQSAAHSTADLAYPPYSDDPGYGARPAYYDPYGGAPADAQYYDVPRGASPGPNAIARGMSPGPGMVYDNRVTSPAPPSMAYADPVGRTGSPGPAGYGYAGGYAQADPYGGRHSPGPNMAYGQPEMDPYGRRSPGPGMAYNGSVGRVASPGPNAGYR